MAIQSKLKYTFVLLFIILFSLSSLAQREKSYIYLFDCTGSMRSNGLWETAQSALDSNIVLRTSIPDSHFTVISFGDEPYEIFTFSNKDYFKNKQDISKSFDNYIRQAKFTNISDVLLSGFSQTNPNKDNEIYLFTDGIPNGGDSPQKVAATLNKWCSSHRNTKLFYVALTNGVINPVIKQAIDACPDAAIVQCQNGIIPVIINIPNDIYTNLEDLDKIVEMPLSIQADVNLIYSSSDSLFDFNIVGSKASSGKIQTKISLKKNLSINEIHNNLQGEEYEFQAKIQCPDQRFVIVNPLVNIHVSDEVPIQLSLANGVEELATEGILWYDSFLWNDAAQDHKAVWDLAPIFQNELQNSQLVLNFQSQDRQINDFQAWFNGHAINNGATINILPNQPAILEIQFNHDAATGKRYFSLSPSAIKNLNFINNQPSGNYAGTSLRTDYEIGWNPLKTILFWIVLVLIACLILWFIILQKIFFPTIKMGKVTFTGPESYYTSKRIKGARKVVLSSKNKKQNIFSRIFTGKIKFIKADFFFPELSIVPAGSRNKVKLQAKRNSTYSWNIYPSSIFSKYDKGIITNCSSNEKSEIEFN